MRAAAYPISNPERVLPTNTQQPRKDKGTHYRGGEPPYYVKDPDTKAVKRMRGTPRTIVRH